MSNRMSPAAALAALGLTWTASDDEIKSTYHKLMSLYHPDANGGEQPEKFLTIRNAYEDLLAAREDGSLQAERARIAAAQAAERSSFANTAGTGPAGGGIPAGDFSASAVQGRSVPAGGGNAPQAPVPEMPVRPAKILGNKSAMQTARIKRRFAAEHAKQEERAKRRHKEEKRRQIEEESRYEENREYDEAMLKIHAVIAAEVAAKLYRELKNG